MESEDESNWCDLTICDGCGDSMPTDDAFWGAKGAFCEGCFTEFETSGVTP